LDDQAGRDDADTARAAQDLFHAALGIEDPLLVLPAAPGPDRRRELEEAPELALPLAEERFRREDEHRAAAPERHQLGGQRELDGLAQADLVGQDEARALAAVGGERLLDEILLVGPEPVLLAVDRQLDR